MFGLAVNAVGKHTHTHPKEKTPLTLSTNRDDTACSDFTGHGRQTKLKDLFTKATRTNTVLVTM